MPHHSDHDCGLLGPRKHGILSHPRFFLMFLFSRFWNWDSVTVSLSLCVAGTVTCKLKNWKSYRLQRWRAPTVHEETNEADGQRNRREKSWGLSMSLTIFWGPDSFSSLVFLTWSHRLITCSFLLRVRGVPFCKLWLSNLNYTVSYVSFFFKSTIHFCIYIYVTMCITTDVILT